MKKNIALICIHFVIWKKYLSKLEINKKQNKKNRRRLKVSISQPIKYQIIKLIKIAWNLEIAVNTRDIIKIARVLCTELKIKSYSALQKWSYGFIRTWRYIIRRITHVGKKLKANSIEQMNELFNILKNIRTNQLIINEKDHNWIWNADETVIWLDLIKGTSIEKIGNKKVNVHSFGNEKVRLSIILCVSATSIKLLPLLIAKGKEGKR